MGFVGSTSEGKRLADFVRSSKARILEAWSEVARGLPGAAPLSQPRLLDHLPELLERIADACDQAQAERAGLGEFPEVHAVERLDEGYDLAAVLAEYSLLRSCVLGLYHREHPGAGSLDEVERFGRAIDESMHAAALRYHRAHERTLVALDRVSEAALESGDEEHFLHRLLQVLLETAGAVDSVILMLREGDRLVVRASAGLLEERAPGFSLRIGEGFSGTIAATRKPLFVRSAATDPLVVSPLIRQKGLRALYGVPLLAGDELLGVAHIGSLSAYEFSNEDKLLFRVMVGRAAALLAQHRLRENEARARRQEAAAFAQLDAFFTGTPLATAFLDRELRYVRVNEALARLNGVTAREHLGRRIGEILPEANASFIVPVLERVLRTGEPLLNVEVDRPVPAQGGAPRTLLVSYFPVRSASGEVLGVGATMLDITERKQAADALDQQRKLYQSLLQAQSDLGEGFALVERGRMAVVNDALCRITGYSAGELTTLGSLAELAPAGEQAALREHLAGLDLEERPQHYEIAVRRKDGQRIDLEISTIPVGNGWRLKLVRDVTFARGAARERERLLAELEGARRQLAAILENLPLGLVVFAAPPGGMLLANSLAEQLQGHPATPDLGRLRGFHPDGRPIQPEEWPLARSLREGEVVRGEEIDYLRPDGKRVTFSVSSAPIRSRDGRIEAAVTAFDDVTEGKRTREELARAVEFRDRVVGILGHDLRNPLASIRIATQLLFRHGDLRETPLRAVSRIDRAAARMNELIGTLMDFSQSRFRGGLPIAPAPTDLTQLVTDLAHELEAAEAGARIEVRASGDTRGLWDPARLSQLISNLLGNAVRYGSDARPVSAIVEGEGDRVTLRVHNWGRPIPPEARPWLFQPFHRATGPDAEGAKHGLGLGLYIASEVVRAHRGTLEVTSTAEAGTTFTVVLPRSAEEVPARPLGG